MALVLVLHAVKSDWGVYVTLCPFKYINKACASCNQMK